MKKQFKRTILAAIFFLGLFGVSASANPLKDPLLMGEIKKVEKCNDSGNIRVIVDGYMKGCETYKDQVLIIIDKNTKMHEGCKKECKEEVKCEVGDYVSVVLDKKITKSIPPQAYAKRVQVTKKKSKSEKQTSVLYDSSRVDEEKNEFEKEDKEIKDKKTFKEDDKNKELKNNKETEKNTFEEDEIKKDKIEGKEE
ncbi:hypothetical protein [Clostridium sardiniense]|uniref:hypothetical protein n=1 Tax=Clostridium sardiniense TaxID=29369 RepID=UPI003D3516C9